MKNNVLFITEKWCDGKESVGLTNNFHNLFGSLQNTNLYSSITLSHYDELYHNYNHHYDDFADQVLDEHHPDVVVVCHMGDSHLNPTNKTYKKIKERNIKLVFMWPDTRMWVYPAIEKLTLYADLHVSWASEKSDEETLCDNHVWMWTPEDSTLYFDGEKKIDVSFIGSLFGYNNIRLNYINYLINNGVHVFRAGGQREDKLSWEDYAQFIRSSKININFSESALIGTFQCKGRVFESISSNSFLLEKENECTRRRFKVGEHYVEFNTEQDLKDKISYFLKNEKERIEIANNAYNFYNKNYSSTIFWKTIFERIK